MNSCLTSISAFWYGALGLQSLPVRSVLDTFRIRELTPVIREDHREQPPEILSAKTMI